MKVTDFIKGTVSYDKVGQYFWITGHTDDRVNMLGELRGWGAIQNMFKKKGGQIDMEAAAKFQDQVGEWVAEAINEKLEREEHLKENPPFSGPYMDYDGYPIL